MHHGGPFNKIVSHHEWLPRRPRRDRETGPHHSRGHRCTCPSLAGAAGYFGHGANVMKTTLATSEQRMLLALVAILAAASLVHFTHNAEFLADYPNLPKSWSPTHVYLAWIGMTTVGVVGWVLVSRGSLVAGLLTLAVYAGLGLDSLGHYLVAPMSAHTAAMNATILAEVTAAGCVLLEVARQIARHLIARARR